MAVDLVRIDSLMVFILIAKSSGIKKPVQKLFGTLHYCSSQNFMLAASPLQIVCCYGKFTL